MAGRQTSKKPNTRRLKDLRVKGKKTAKVKGGATALKTYKLTTGMNVSTGFLGVRGNIS